MFQHSLHKKKNLHHYLSKSIQEIVHRRPPSTVFNAGCRLGESSASYIHSPEEGRAEAEGTRQVTTLEEAE